MRGRRKRLDQSGVHRERLIGVLEKETLGRLDGLDKVPELSDAAAVPFLPFGDYHHGGLETLSVAR